VNEKGEISQFSNLSRYSCNSCPGTMFMLVPDFYFVVDRESTGYGCV
jgi:hypothetical protein